MAVCKKCNSKYVPDMGYGPQDYCNFCAHRVVAKLQAENEKLKEKISVLEETIVHYKAGEKLAF